MLHVNILEDAILKFIKVHAGKYKNVKKKKNILGVIDTGNLEGEQIYIQI